MNKKEILLANGTFNKNHGKVKNKKFLIEPFYDSMDIVQVKYEMLKDATEGSRQIANVADDFGLSRASFYKIKEAFEIRGLSALVPEKPGPKKPYKLTEPYAEYIDKYISEKPKASSNEIATNLRKDKGLKVSKRTVERYRNKKKLY